MSLPGQPLCCLNYGAKVLAARGLLDQTNERCKKHRQAFELILTDVHVYLSSLKKVIIFSLMGNKQVVTFNYFLTGPLT